MPSGELNSGNVGRNGFTHATSQRTFTVISDKSYRFECLPAGIVFEVERLRRESHNLVGELRVTVNGNFQDAKTLDGVMVWGDTNFSAIQTRQQRAKLMAARSGADDVDWYGLLEDFAIRLLKAEIAGEPAIRLADIEVRSDEAMSEWTIDGFPLLVDDPMIVFGDPSAGKSYFALWLAVELAQRSLPVLYIDWEFSRDQQRRRLERLAAPVPRELYYIRREGSLVRAIDSLRQTIRRLKIQYVISDSVGFAIQGFSPSDPEAATEYFAAARNFGCGSLHLAHQPKQAMDGSGPSIFGSQFWKAGARSVWFIERSSEQEPHEMKVGLVHKKFNGGALCDPLQYRIAFANHRTTIQRADLTDSDEFAVHLPLHERIKRTIRKDGALTIRELSEALSVEPNKVRSILSRHAALFVKVGQKWNLKQPSIDF